MFHPRSLIRPTSKRLYHGIPSQVTPNQENQSPNNSPRRRARLVSIDSSDSDMSETANHNDDTLAKMGDGTTAASLDRPTPNTHTNTAVLESGKPALDSGNNQQTSASPLRGLQLLYPNATFDKELSGFGGELKSFSVELDALSRDLVSALHNNRESESCSATASQSANLTCSNIYAPGFLSLAGSSCEFGAEPTSSDASTSPSSKSSASSQKSLTSLHKPTTASHQSPTASHKSPTASHKSPTSSHQSLTSSHQSPTPSNQSPTPSNQSPTPSNQSPTSSLQSSTPLGTGKLPALSINQDNPMTAGWKPLNTFDMKRLQQFDSDDTATTKELIIHEIDEPLGVAVQRKQKHQLNTKSTWRNATNRNHHHRSHTKASRRGHASKHRIRPVDQKPARLTTSQLRKVFPQMSLGKKPLVEALADGVLLCDILRAHGIKVYFQRDVKPGSPEAHHNIRLFADACRRLGVHESNILQPEDFEPCRQSDTISPRTQLRVKKSRERKIATCLQAAKPHIVDACPLSTSLWLVATGGMKLEDFCTSLYYQLLAQPREFHVKLVLVALATAPMWSSMIVVGLLLSPITIAFAIFAFAVATMGKRCAQVVGV